ncbi:metallophosphoesterase YmdB [Mycoplasma wenyonii str. Massachusetts]|uniref:Metallophosphoesterase YmdB n=1 Tax=Mycoplasma wenyonii (strain Massachusetts) TaxID=1197325 RepID=I6ZJQ7_MYCWM|nr:TIGR00282 family metallophosphoesterase [Mycoplasma wenyonii]AFN65445.1 metallophosphoesterase YmdB [Mycoplasma wenyonii str. Massachusetts]
MEQQDNTHRQLKVLFIGDIFGKPGRDIIKEYLPRLKEEYSVDLVIANAENSAHGKGVTPKILNQLIEVGVDFFTLGNHSWAKRECLKELFNTYSNLVRPLNLKESFPYCSLGQGSKEFTIKGTTIRVTNLMGNSVVFKGNQSNCFLALSKLLDQLKLNNFKGIHIVDFHAETTSEKNAFLWAFNGKVSAILGTHTHIPTNDFVVTEEGTAYITDIGMTGPSCGVIGGAKHGIIEKFFYPEKRFILEPESGPRQICSVLLTFDTTTYKAISIQPVILREGYREDIYKLTTS